MKLKFTKTFAKNYDKTDSKIKAAVDTRLKLFASDPFNPQLNNHNLKGKSVNFSSINITGDWRIIFHIAEEDLAVLDRLGTHSELYR